MSSQPIQPQFFRPLTRREAYSRPSATEFYPYVYFRAHYLHEIAEDCAERCVYCDAHESEVGGREAMQIDHFRPHSRPEFKHLENVPTNFHHSCTRCNNWKRAKWPSTDPNKCHDGRAGFVDPFADDRRLYFEVLPDGEVRGLNQVGRYLIRLFSLNRPFLRLLRLRRILRAQLEDYRRAREPEWDAAVRGEGSLTREQLAAEFNEFRRLCDISAAEFHG